MPDCQLRDEMWRLHRALGRDADRVQRWYLLPHKEREAVTGEFLGEHISRLYDVVTDQDLGSYRVWLADPEGHVVISYGGQIHIKDIYTDLRYLLRRNPAPPQWRAALTKPGLSADHLSGADNE